MTTGGKHLICLTVDTDPDGLSGRAVNRGARSWAGLEAAQSLPGLLASTSALAGRSVSITWFVRADDQIAGWFGSPGYLLERYAPFWDEARAAGHELGWHPHLYVREEGGHRLATPDEAVEQLERVFGQMYGPGFRPSAFRNGEGWHTPATYAAVERLGLLADSTAIPGRVAAPGHPLDWEGAPNRPYYPSPLDVRRPGPPRDLVEVPMTTWLVRAPYDPEPRLRYLNPAVHGPIFDEALDGWDGSQEGAVCVWVLICHPDDFWSGAGPDHLYARSPVALVKNLGRLLGRLEGQGHAVEFTCVSDAARAWASKEGGA